MKSFDEGLPEEQDPQYEELITLLRQANLNPLFVDPIRRAQLLARAKARLTQTDSHISQPEDPPVPTLREVGSLPSTPTTLADKPLRGRRFVHMLNMLAAVLVIAALLGASLLLFQHRLPPTGNHVTNATGAYASFVAKNGIMFGFDAQHTNANPFEKILNPTTVGHLQEKWAYQTRGPIGSPAAVTGDVVYVGSGDNNVYALDVVSGAKKWSYHTGNNVASSPAVVGGVVYVGSADGNIYALDAASGAKKWAFRTGNPVLSSPAVAGGVVYIGANDGNVYALDAASGTKKWAFRTGNQVFSSPAVAGGVVYVGSANHVYALDAASGAKKWAYYTRFSDDSSPAVAGGVVYIGAIDGNVYALDAVSGAKKWIYHTGGPMGIYSSPTVAGGVVFIGSYDGNVYALDAASGAKKWAFRIGSPIDPSPVVAEGVLYVGSRNMIMYAFHLPGT